MEKEKLAELAHKFINGTASAEEKKLLHSWYDAWQDDDEIISLQEFETKEDVGNKILLRIRREFSKTNEVPVIKPRRYFFRYIAASAMVILIISLAFYLFFTPEHEKKIVAPALLIKHDAAPGGNKAMLTLADGTVITLDSAQNGSLARQGSTIISKKKDGQLLYSDGTSKANSSDQEILYNKISTPKGGQYQLVLPDGSKVWLNAISSLRYPASFSGKERKVELTGEAYFEVSPMQDKNSPDRHRIPFIVSLNGMEVQVLGTHFNVNAYEDEATIKTTLLEGKVNIRSVTGKQQYVTLLPGEQSQWNINEGKIQVIKDADVEQAVAWKNGLFKFNSTDLQTIMRQVARWYDVDITYQGNVKEETFSGDMPREKYVSEIFKMLEMTKTIQLSIEERKITIEPYKK